MIRNTQELVDTLKFWAGGITIAAAGVAGLAIVEGVRRRRVYHRPYNPETFEEISGKINKIFLANDEQAARGVTIVLETKEGTIPVHLGPAWFINRQNIRFKVGEEITVGGSRVHYHGREIFVAATIQYGKVHYRLRQRNGNPYWQSKIKS